jgi:steroid 5-alpha reductase family enzyme
MTLIGLVLAACLVGLWLVSLPLKNSSIIDIFWGLGFVLIAWLSVLQHPLTDRAVLMAALVTAWGLRLAGYLAWRNLGKGEDARYAAMRAAHGKAWPLRSLFIVFGLQGLLMLVISAPVQLAIASAGTLGPLDGAGAVLSVTGIAFETTGDLQLAAFKRHHRGEVMDRGVWRYTRHPNYFGDAVTWWGFFLIALSAGGWWALVSPVVMTVLLRRVSGVPLLEQAMGKRPGYAEYVRRTSPFFPWFPKA